MMLPKPHGSFTLPSLHDELELNCRLYFPRREETADLAFVTGFAIFAHPYAPLGGSFDDPVVNICGSLLLKKGFILSTFNFRGAESSPGRTSWSGKPELGDYVSLVAFMISFMNTLGLSQYVRSSNTESSTASWLLLGGYSYGSMIASHLPDVDMVCQLLAEGGPGSTAHEIYGRAQDLAKAFLGYAESQQTRGRKNLRPDDIPSPSKLGIAVGGYESESASRRISRESSRRSIDGDRVRHSVERMRQKLNPHSASVQGEDVNAKEAGKIALSVIPKTAFLLVSPILGMISGFTTMFQTLEFKAPNQLTASSKGRKPSSSTSQLWYRPACVIYGDEDTFTSSRKLQNWCSEIKAKPNSQLTSHEIHGAGHFWQQEQPQRELANAMHSWLGATILL